MEGGSITAALIFGAIVSVFTLIVSRGSKISELRQAWINDQRADFATFGAAALSLGGLRSKDRPADFDKLEAAAYRIRLRENPRKNEWAPVITQMDSIRETLLADDSAKVDVFPALVTIGGLAQQRLKGDWNKVRFGETGYRWLPVFLVILVGALIWMGYGVLADRKAGDESGCQVVASGSAMPSSIPSARQRLPVKPTRGKDCHG